MAINAPHTFTPVIIYRSILVRITQITCPGHNAQRLASSAAHHTAYQLRARVLCPPVRRPPPEIVRLANDFQMYWAGVRLCFVQCDDKWCERWGAGAFDVMWCDESGRRRFKEYNLVIVYYSCNCLCVFVCDCVACTPSNSRDWCKHCGVNKSAGSAKGSQIRENYGR